MTGMKRLLLVFFIFILFSSIPTERVCFATDSPYIVVGENVWLCGEQGEKIFLLPESYYAAVVGIDETYYTVVFNGVSGKVPKASVSVVGYHEQAAGTAQTLHVSEKYSAFTGLKLRLSPDTSADSDEAFVPVGEPFTYLGAYPTADGTWYYVCYGEAYGYVLSDFCDRTVEIKPFVPEQKTESPIEEEEEEKKEDGLLKILVVSGVAVTIVILLLVLILPRKGKKTRYYYET